MRFVASFSSFFSSATAQAAAIERFKTFVRGTQAARADFEQKVHDRNGKLAQESKGSFVFQRPGLFRWIYAKPVDQVIVGDGERVWIHDRDLNQVTVRKLSRALGSTPAALLAGSADIEKAFELSDAGSQGRPGVAGGEAARARSRLRARAHGLRRRRPARDGAARPLRPDHAAALLNLRRNPKVDKSEFRFEPPKGADVLGEK